MSSQHIDLNIYIFRRKFLYQQIYQQFFPLERRRVLFSCRAGMGEARPPHVSYKYRWNPTNVSLITGTPPKVAAASCVEPYFSAISAPSLS